ncbi:MAG: glycosyltransferase family 2 protein [Alistipes sp.]|nr:glycosyltransferase family 2 protein [Alistipes sp.]
MIRLSLVIATYNRAEQLMVTLNSVATQSKNPAQWECIVVDNNSKDSTKERVEEFIAEHPTLNILYHFEPNQGLSHARNAGIAKAQGDIIAFIDDDERIVPDFIGTYINLFDNYPTAMAAGGKIIAEYPTGRPRWMSHYTERPIANPMDFGDYVRIFPKGRIPGGGNMAMRREVFERIGVFNTSLGRTGKSLIGGEESELFERIAEAGMECYYTPRAVMYHIIPEEKLCDSYFERLCYNTGVSQLTRAKIHHRTTRLYIGEVAKWCATLLLCLLHRPAQSKYLLRMRAKISKAIFGKGAINRK